MLMLMLLAEVRLGRGMGEREGVRETVRKEKRARASAKRRKLRNH